MSDASTFWFDEVAARAAENFFDHVLVHVKGEWAGQPFTLDPWQREEVIRPLFGWKRRDGAHPDGWVRRHRVAYIEIPRKNGKSSLAAGIALYLLFADGEPGAEVYSAAAWARRAVLPRWERHLESSNPLPLATTLECPFQWHPMFSRPCSRGQARFRLSGRVTRSLRWSHRKQRAQLSAQAASAFDASVFAHAYV